MPTIEIASINATGIGLNQSDFEVAIIEENKLESHRGLFYDLLQKQNGTIVHIGNPDFKNDKDGGFFGGAIIDWNFSSNENVIIPAINSDGTGWDGAADQQILFKFQNKYKPDIDKLLKTALDRSPIKRIYFLTDYQFGPKKEKVEIVYTISDFWSQHDKEGLRFNTLYEMFGR